MTLRPGGLRNDQVAGLALVAFAFAVAWETWRKLPVGSLADPGPGYAPLLLAVLLALFGIAVVAFGGQSPRLRERPWSEAGHAAKILAGCAFAAFAIERLGYRLTIMVLLVAFLGVLERKKPLAVAAVALGLSFGTYYLFSDILRVRLPTGPWGI